MAFHKKRLVTLCLSVMGWTFFVIIIWGGITIYLVDVRLGENLQSEFGFTVRTPYSSEWGEVLRIESIRTDSPLWRAGIRNGDVIVGIRSTEFYRRLDRLRKGNRTQVQVAAWNEGRYVPESEWRTINLGPS